MDPNQANKQKQQGSGKGSGLAALTSFADVDGSGKVSGQDVVGLVQQGLDTVGQIFGGRGGGQQTQQEEAKPGIWDEVKAVATPANIAATAAGVVVVAAVTNAGRKRRKKGRR